MQSAVIAIPARNEAARIAGCLDALAQQRDVGPFQVVLLLNNCTDGSPEIVDALAPALPFTLHALRCDLPPDRAHAGGARSLAMDRAARLAGLDGVLLTTDADGRVAPDWLAQNLRALRAGADAVAGRAVIDPVEAALIPAALHEADARECAYAALLDEIAARFDPDPADPWPRHDEHSGASIAVTVAAWREAGGMPAVRLGEDRAFFAALRRIDSRIRHAPEVQVVVSGRTQGRAVGGMADTIRRRMQAPDLMLDDRLEAAEPAARRAHLRRAFREALGTGDPGPVGRVAERLQLPAAWLLGWCGLGFGAAWDLIETHSPVLRRVTVPVADLPVENLRASDILARHAATAKAPGTREDRGDSSPTMPLAAAA